MSKLKSSILAGMVALAIASPTLTFAKNTATVEPEPIITQPPSPKGAPPLPLTAKPGETYVLNQYNQWVLQHIDESDDGMDKGETALDGSEAETQSELNQKAGIAAATSDCDPDVAQKIAENNEKLVNALIVNMGTYIGKPTKTTEIDCLSQLTSMFKVGFSFKVPSVKSIFESFIAQAKQKACNIAMKKVTDITDSLGLDGSIGGQFTIPGTTETISGGVGTGFVASGTSTVDALAVDGSVDVSESGDISGSGTASASAITSSYSSSQSFPVLDSNGSPVTGSSQTTVTQGDVTYSYDDNQNSNDEWLLQNRNGSSGSVESTARDYEPAATRAQRQPVQPKPQEDSLDAFLGNVF